MLTKPILLLLTVSLFCSCAYPCGKPTPHNDVEPFPEIEECWLVDIEPIDQAYGYCVNNYNASLFRRIPLGELLKMKYTAMSLDDNAKVKLWIKNVSGK